MRAKRAVRWVLVGGAVIGAVLLTSGCGGGKDVTFTPAANSSGVQAADGSAPATTSTSGGSAGSSGSAGATPPGISIRTQGSSICVRNKDTGSEACVSRQGTAVVNGVVIVDGKVVSTAGSSGGDSVVVNGGGNVVVGGNAAGVPMTGTVTLGGAVQWRGSAKGTCERTGDVRHAKVTLGNGGTLSVDVVGTGVVRIDLSTGGDVYSGNWVGDNSFISLADKSLTVSQAPLGRGSDSVQLSATLAC